jgi:hypothetical protein
MVATQSVELTSRQQPEEAQVAWPPYPRVNERTEGVDNARADDQLAGDVQFRSTGWTTPAEIQWRTGHRLSPRNICTESRSSIVGTLAKRSERTVIPRRPAAEANSGSRVPATKCDRSQVERRRAQESLGCPGGTIKDAVSALARLRDVE